MGDCCQGENTTIEKLARDHRVVLWTVLVINLVMFGAEAIAGWLASSSALIGDSLDMLGDAVTYGSSIAVVGRAGDKKASVARLKAWIMLIFGLVISARCLYRAAFPVMPDFGVMLLVGGAALVANLICLGLLTRHRNDDINMKSVWICSRNDIIANTAVLAAAGLVFGLASPLPDLFVGIGLAFLFTRSALMIFREAGPAAHPA